jgi:hypothetical protein
VKPAPESPPPGKHTPTDHLRPRHELDAMVANIELTLISIVQGVALYFLTDSSRAVLADLRFDLLPYVVSGLLIILTVWTRSLLHAFTVIRWPLELGHNFFYVLITLFEATLFTQIHEPLRWYPMSAATAGVVLVMFVYERRMYTLRRKDSAGPKGAVLLDVLERDHDLSLRALVPMLVLAWSGSAALVLAYPEVFLAGQWHIALGIAQALGLLGYLAYVWRFYLRISELVVDARAEWDRPS